MLWIQTRDSERAKERKRERERQRERKREREKENYDRAHSCADATSIDESGLMKRSDLIIVQCTVRRRVYWE